MSGNLKDYIFPIRMNSNFLIISITNCIKTL